MVFLVPCTACLGASVPKAPDAQSKTNAPRPLEVAEVIYEGGLKNRWQESGSAARDHRADGPARIRFDASGDWTLVRPDVGGPYGAVVFRVKEPYGEGEFLEVGLGARDGRTFRLVKLEPDHCTDALDGWTQVRVPMAELNPAGATFDRIVFRPFRPFAEWVLFDKIGLEASSAPSSGPPSVIVDGTLGSVAPASGPPRRVRIGCDAKATAISQYIYGVAAADDGWDRLGATVRRRGGNPMSRYNWEGHFSNRASDWFFENGPQEPYTDFLANSMSRGMTSAVTVPIIGWVAKDATSYSFPVSVFGPQAQTDPWHPDVGNGVGPSGSNIEPGPPSRTSVEAPPGWVRRWVSAIRAADGTRGKSSVYEYILDNEPMLWSRTHRDVHPDPLGYDELLDRTVRYGRAIREADPNAIIAGPAEWGWSNYFFSAKDLASGSSGLHADRLRHLNVPLVEWYLRQMQEYEQKTGMRLLDVLDLHYYPQENNVYGGGNGGVDRETQLLRLRATRSLWDPTYVDESWIKDTVRLLPRMKEWVERNYPGRGISIGEWNFGGQQDITGALATAEALGRFAQFGVTSAFYWTSPPAGSPSAFGFRAYRNFDGKGAHFLDWYVPTTSISGLSLFASRDEQGKHVVVVAINMAPDTPVSAELDLGACGGIASAQAYTYTSGASSFAPGSAQTAGATVARSLAPWSITVFDIRLSEERAPSPK